MPEHRLTPEPQKDPESPSNQHPPPWWRPWRGVLGGFVLSFVVGIACASGVKAFGDWNQGFRWERELMLWIHRPVSPIVDAMFYMTPWFGTNITLIPAVIIVVWWVWKPLRRPDLAVQLLIVQIGSYLLNPSLKALFDRERPDLFERRGWFAWSSYPSGHAIASVSVLMMIAVVLYRAKGWKWPFALLVPTMLASLYSRIYLGVHWPTDVFAGIIVGAVWFAASAYAFRNRRLPSGEQLAKAGAVNISPADDRRDARTVS
jgi:membrane-associated phospholipid phosphatase